MGKWSVVGWSGGRVVGGSVGWWSVDLIKPDLTLANHLRTISSSLV